MLAKPEYFSPPDEVCCWPGRCGEETGGAEADSHREDAADREPIKNIIGKNLLAKAHKNLDFVLEKPENEGFGG